MATVGETVQFRCMPNSGNIWTLNDGALPANVNILGPLQQVLQISKAMKRNEGTYKCITKGENGSDIVQEGTLVVFGEFSKKSFN